MGKKYQKKTFPSLNRFFCPIIFVGIVCVVAAWLYHNALQQMNYSGLPTVPCLDYTKSVVQSYSFWIQITVAGKPYPLSSHIGHDNGNCLHDIFVQDTSGKVFVQANDKETFTLGQFFDVWKMTFTDHQIGRYILPLSKKMHILVNGQAVTTGRSTLLEPNDYIEMDY